MRGRAPDTSRPGPDQSGAALFAQSHDARGSIEVAVLAGLVAFPVKTDALAVVQRPVPLGIDVAEVREDIARDSWGSENTPPFIVVPTLHDSVDHPIRLTLTRPVVPTRPAASLLRLAERARASVVSALLQTRRQTRASRVLVARCFG